MSDCQANLDLYPLAADLYIAMEMGYQVSVETDLPNGKRHTGIVTNLTPFLVVMAVNEGVVSILLRHIKSVETKVVLVGYAS